MVYALILLMALNVSAQFLNRQAPVECSAQLHRIDSNHAILGITLSPETHWHLYWSNPGEAGLAPSVTLDHSTLEISPQDFPIPIRFETIGIIGYGYESTQTFLFTIRGEIPPTLTGEAQWLACDQNACLPGSQRFSLSSTSQTDWLQAAQSSQPTPLHPSDIQRDTQNRRITFSFASDTELAGWSVYPYDETFAELSLTQVAREHERYTFTFSYIGEVPTKTSFLITDGKLGYKVTL